MPGHSEHVNGSDTFYLISVFSEVLHISRQGWGIAADVNYLLRGHFYDGLETELITAFSWRVDHDHVGFDVILFVLFRKNLLGFSDEEFYIIETVALRILSGILDRCRNDLDTADFSGFLGEERGDGSDSTVEIPDGLTAV